MSCPNARCCIHACGCEARQHGPFKPDNPSETRYAYVCCNCGCYEDSSGRPLARENIHFFSEKD